MSYTENENGTKTAGPDKPTPLYRNAAWMVGWLAYGLFRLKIIRGKDSLPESGGYIVACNHISVADPVFLRFANKRQIHYMAKAELFKNPFTRWLCRSYGAFPVERGSADSTALDTAIEILDGGKVLGIFPEGTRSKDGKIGRGKSGTIFLAYRADKPIYPCAVYSKRKPLSPFSCYTVAFGEPVTVQELGVTTCTGREMREATRRLMDIISGLHEECRRARE